MTHDETKRKVREKYYEWLINKIGPNGNEDIKHKVPGDTYETLLIKLHEASYSYAPYDIYGFTSIRNDENRYKDGTYLRYEFVCDNRMPEEWQDTMLYGDCSVLEMLVALCLRSDVFYSGGPSKLFWHIIENMGLIDCSDNNFDFEQINMIDQAIETLNNRLYNYNGAPGPFRVHSGTDARSMELWAQCIEYCRDLETFENN